MGAAVVDRAELAGRGCFVEEHAGGVVERVGEDLGLGDASRPVAERLAEREELAEGVPAQIVLLENCWTCFGAEPPAPVSKRPPPFMSGTMESILAEVPSSRIGNRSVL